MSKILKEVNDMSKDELDDLIAQLERAIELSPEPPTPKKPKKEPKEKAMKTRLLKLSDSQLRKTKLICPVGGFIKNGIRYGNDRITTFWKAFGRLPDDVAEFKQFVVNNYY
jgi:hypothetical protein